jgi:hypothetical protein
MFESENQQQMPDADQLNESSSNRIDHHKSSNKTDHAKNLIY